MDQIYYSFENILSQNPNCLHNINQLLKTKITNYLPQGHDPLDVVVEPILVSLQ